MKPLQKFILFVILAFSGFCPSWAIGGSQDLQPRIEVRLYSSKPDAQFLESLRRLGSLFAMGARRGHLESTRIYNDEDREGATFCIQPKTEGSATVPELVHAIQSIASETGWPIAIDRQSSCQ